MAVQSRGPCVERAERRAELQSPNQNLKGAFGSIQESDTYMFTPGIPGPIVLCGGLMPPPKFWENNSNRIHDSFLKLQMELKEGFSNLKVFS